MLFSKYKIRRLVIRLITAAVILALLYLAINLLGGLFTFDNGGNNVVTEKEKREEKYNEPMLGNKEIKEQDIEKIKAVIDNFYNYCNNKNYEQAYAMLSEDSKKASFNTLELFKQRIDMTFDKLKLYRYKNVINFENQYLYRIALYDDVMAYGSNEFPTEDYYYIVINKNEENYTISLDGLLSRKELNYKINSNNIEVIIESKEIYYEETKINYTIKNNSTDIVIINGNSIKLVTSNDKNEKEYKNNNISFGDNNMYFTPGMIQEISTSFDANNIADYKDDRIEFNNIYTISNELYEQNEYRITQEIIEDNYISKFNIQIPL